MARKLYPDKWLFLATVGLALFGLVMVYSASAITAEKENGTQYYYVAKQAVWTGIGLVVMFIMMQLDYSWLRNRRIVYALLFVTVLMLLAVFGFSPINGARRWIKLKTFSIQPSEMSKLTLTIFLAYFLEQRAGEESLFWKTFVPCAFVTGALAVLVVAEPDLGTALMLGVIFVVVIFTAGARLSHLAIAAAPALIGLAGLLIFVPFRVRRLTAFLDPWADPQGTSYQVVQSLIAVGSGGMHGLGFAQGKQKLFFLPFAHSDFIFAVVGEELGLAGACGGARLWNFPVAGRSDSNASARSVWNVSSAGSRSRNRSAGAIQYQCGVGDGAYERHSVAVCFLRWLVNGSNARGGRHLAEYFAVRRGLAGFGIAASVGREPQGRCEGGPGSCNQSGSVATLWISEMRALIAAGGTGGHIYPALAVAHEIMRRAPDSQVRFVGTARGLETRLVPQAGFELSLIESAGLVNMGLAARARGLAILPRSLVAARRLLKNFQPQVVVGAGGYVTGPVLLTAALRGLPTLVMESNAIPGFTNRRLARFVRAAAVSFDATVSYFPGKAIVTGNPVRPEFFEIPEQQRDSARISLLLFGGSQGSRALNEAMVAALPQLETHRESLHITHQTGPSDFARMRSAYEQAGWITNAEVREYIDDMVEAFAKADLIMCRAGAATSAGLAAAGRAAIMVPLPGQLEQQRNAEVLQSAGGARMILQSALSGARLAHEINDLVAAPERITEMERAVRTLARPGAAAATVDLIEQLIAQQGRV